jgi:hypothetical protein
MRNIHVMCAGFLVLASTALPKGKLNAQTLQLPTFNSFSVETSVLVPDRGSATMGGVRRSSSAGSQFGPLRGTRATGRQAGAGGVDVAAHVHDFEALDKSVLAEAARRRGDTAAEKIATLTQRDNAPVESVAEIRRRQAQSASDQPDETDSYLAKARDAVAAGKPTVAKVYFQMAERRASPAMKTQIRAELAAIAPGRSNGSPQRQVRK